MTFNFLVLNDFDGLYVDWTQLTNKSHLRIFVHSKEQSSPISNLRLCDCLPHIIYLWFQEWYLILNLAIAHI
jgi:hypothetical protein